MTAVRRLAIATQGFRGQSAAGGPTILATGDTEIIASVNQTTVIPVVVEVNEQIAIQTIQNAQNVIEIDTVETVKSDDCSTYS